jgi:hypothetical protein
LGGDRGGGGEPSPHCVFTSKGRGFLELLGLLNPLPPQYAHKVKNHILFPLTKQAIKE